METWQQVHRGFALFKNGHHVIVPAIDYKPSVPLFCPICDFPMRTADDREAFADLGCCEECLFRWAQARREEWKAGWRPPADDFALYLVDREQRPPRIRLK